MEEPIKLINISLNSVKYSPPNLSCPKKVFTNLSQLRPIILDENKQLVANKSAYLLYKLQDKKTIPAWQISLPDLLARKYLPTLLAQFFLICERAAIGIAAKNYLGNRQGPRIHKPFRRNFDEIVGRTDELLAASLGFGSKDTYRQVEKIQLLGSDVLIQFVNDGILKISAAAQLTRFTHKKQKKILTLNKKEIRNFIYRFKRR